MGDNACSLDHQLSDWWPTDRGHSSDFTPLSIWMTQITKNFEMTVSKIFHWEKKLSIESSKNGKVLWGWQFRFFRWQITKIKVCLWKNVFGAGND